MPSPIINAAIDTAASGNTTLVAAVTGRRIRVVSYVLVAANTVTAKFTSAAGGTALTGPMTMAAGSPIYPGYAGTRIGGGYDGHLVTNPGEALVLNLGGAVQVSGHLSYVLD